MNWETPHSIRNQVGISVNEDALKKTFVRGMKSLGESASEGERVLGMRERGWKDWVIGWLLVLSSGCGLAAFLF